MGIGDEIRRARIARNLSQRQLADMIGVKQPTIAHIETNETVRSKHLPAIMRALGMKQSLVPLVGYVSAGSVATLFDGEHGPFDEVAGPEDATIHTVAVEIRGESLGPIFDQWIVFYDDVHNPPSDHLFGRLCVVGCADGRVMIKKLKPGQIPGHYHLFSNTEPPIYDVVLDWAAEVKAMRPR